MSKKNTQIKGVGATMETRKKVKTLDEFYHLFDDWYWKDASREDALRKREDALRKRGLETNSEILWYARRISYYNAFCPETSEAMSAFDREILDFAADGGFIRYDIEPKSFLINNLYNIVFEDIIDRDPGIIPTCFEDFEKTKGIRTYKGYYEDEQGHCYYYDHLQLVNKRYEAFEVPSDIQFESIKESIRSCLTEGEYAIFAYKFGFEDGNIHTYDETGKHFYVTSERVRQVESRALHKIKTGNVLPAIIPAPSEQRKEIIDVLRRLEELRKGPDFEAEFKLLQSLYNSPFKDAKEALKCLESGDIDNFVDGPINNFSDIGRLELSVRAYNCLTRAGIRVVGDILDFPKKKWPRIRNLGPRTLSEIVSAMHAAGYVDFSVEAEENNLS